MKTLRTLPIVLAGVFVLQAHLALAQPPRLMRGDVSATVGSESVDKRGSSRYERDDFDAGFYGGLSAGWYWTEHLKTEIDFSGRTKARVYDAGPIVLAGTQTYYNTERTFTRPTLAIGQHFQFFHNAWFHPHVAAGAHLAWERSTMRSAAITVYDPVARLTRLVQPERFEPEKTTFMVNPYLQTGFKAYMTQRSFVRSDVRVAFRGGVDDVLLRFGFGVDF